MVAFVLFVAHPENPEIEKEKCADVALLHPPHVNPKP